MADDGEKKASSLQNEEQHDEGNDKNDYNVEVEFKVADYNDGILPGWHLATVYDVENNMEQVKSELCGMTFNFFSLTDGTVGGPGYGYKISNETGINHDHKLLISGASAVLSEVLPVMHMKKDEIIVIDSNKTSQDVLNMENIDASSVSPRSTLVTTETTLLVSEESTITTILTVNECISTDIDSQQQNPNETLIIQTSVCVEAPDHSLQDEMETSRNKEAGCLDDNKPVEFRKIVYEAENGDYSEVSEISLGDSPILNMGGTETTLPLSEACSNDVVTTKLVSEESTITTMLNQNECISTDIDSQQQNLNEILTIQTTVCVEAPDHSVQVDMITLESKGAGLSDDDKPVEIGKIDFDDVSVITDVQHSYIADSEEIYDVSCLEEKPGEKSSDSSPSTRKKKAKPMSVSMQRLTAKKGESPESKRSNDLISAEDRKAKADELRKKKISEQRNKDDERRAAVLERRKKIEDAEREKKEALFRKLTNTDGEKPTAKQNNINKRYSLSTSNLSQLKKTKRVEYKIDLNATTVPKKTENKLKDTKFNDRSKSAMQRHVSDSNAQSGKILTNADTKKGPDQNRPMTAEPRSIHSTKSTVLKTSGVTAKSPATKASAAKSSTKPFTKPPISKPSLNPRSASACGVPNADKRQSLPSRQSRVSTAEKNPSNSTTSIRKTHSATGLLSKHKEDTKPAPVKKGVSNLGSEKKKEEVKKNNLTTQKKDFVKKELSNEAADKKKEKPKPLKTTTTATKEKKTNVPSDNKLNDASPKKKSSTTSKKMGKSENKQKDAKTEKPGQMTEEEAKKALAERRKKAKEEAEAKAKAEREKDELERIKREEEESRLAEQLKLEEEKQAALMEQLKKEEEERRQKLMDEKEQREREERERLEEEQHQREEEIERKAKLELDKIQKEQEKQELLLNKERIDRKKRVEMIMARVSQKRTTTMDDSQNADSPSTLPVETISPPELVDSARLKVDGILRSRGFGKSSEDLSILNDKPGESNVSATHTDASPATHNISETNNEIESKSETDNEPLTTNDESCLPTIDTPVENGVKGNQLFTSVEDTPTSTKDIPIQLEESPASLDRSNISSMETPVLLEEAPSMEQKKIKNDEALPSGDDIQSRGDAPLIIDDILGGYQKKIENATDFPIAPDTSKKENETNVQNIFTKDINVLPNETLPEIDLSIEEKCIEQVSNHGSINDTNNNKNYHIDNRSVPIIAWNENQSENIVIESDQKITLIIESAEKLQNHDMGPDNVCIEKCPKQAQNDPEIHMNGNQDGNKIVNGSGDIHLIKVVKSEEILAESESDQWSKFEERMKQIQPTVDQVAGNEENKLWKVLEGKVELSECF